MKMILKQGTCSRPVSRLPCSCISIGCRQPVLHKRKIFGNTHQSAQHVRIVSAAAHDSNRHAQSTTVSHVDVAGQPVTDERLYNAQADAFIGSVAVQAVPGGLQMLWVPAVCWSRGAVLKSA
jgi:hypothetical protein